MSRGGARKGSGPKPRAGSPLSEQLPLRLTESQLWWARHVATHSGLTVAEWLRSLVDRAVSEHRCGDCDQLNRAARRAERSRR